MSSTSPWDREVLIKTIFLEARGEPDEGQQGCTFVILNRAKLNRSYWGGSKVADVCLKPEQFECWNQRHPTDIRISDTAEWGRVIRNVDLVVNGKVRDLTHGSDHYNNPDKEGFKSWMNNVDKTVKIGNHQFYKSKPGH